MITDDYRYLCPECSCQDIVYDRRRGDIICKTCGLVLKEHCCDPEGGVNSYPEDNPLYPRIPVERYSGGKGTRIRKVNKDDSGRKLDPAAALKAKKLRKTEKWFRCQKKKHDDIAIVCINEIIRRSYPEFVLSWHLIQEMRKLMKLAVSIDIQWKNWRCLAAAVFCLVYKNNREKNPIKEISELVGFTGNRIFKDLKKLIFCNRIQESFKKAENEDARKNFVYNHATALELPMNIKAKLFPAFKEIMESGKFVGKDPSGVLAGLIYGVCKEREDVSRTQKDVAEIVHVTEVTLRNRHKEIRRFFPEIIITMKSS
jgi:transcription initiation factor TFIIB